MILWEIFAQMVLSFIYKDCGYDVVKHGKSTVMILYVKRIIPPQAAGQTWGRIVFIKEEFRSKKDNGLLAHELVHVDQWERDGLKFPIKYAWQFFKRLPFKGPMEAYKMIDYEVEARELSRH